MKFRFFVIACLTSLAGLLAPVASAAPAADGGVDASGCREVSAKIKGASISGKICRELGGHTVYGKVKDTADDDRQAVFRVQFVQHMAPGYDQTTTSDAATTKDMPAGSTKKFKAEFQSDKDFVVQPCTENFNGRTCADKWY
jgi:hypothetical protein